MAISICHSDRMRISCPSCQTLYEVPDALIEPGKPMRCARCAAEWIVEPLQTVIEPIAFEPVFAPPPEPSPVPPQPPPVPLRVLSPLGRRYGVALGWLLSMLVVAGLLVAAYVFRAEIVAAWPNTQRVFDGLGIR